MQLSPFYIKSRGLDTNQPEEKFNLQNSSENIANNERTQSLDKTKILNLI